MKIQAGCELRFTAEADVPIILMLRPRSGDAQWIVSDQYLIDPVVPVTEFTDTYGNLCQRLVVPAGPFTVSTSTQAETADDIDVAVGGPYTPVQELPTDILGFLLASRYCPSDQPAIAKQAAAIVEGLLPGYNQAEAIRKWIHEQITYQYGTSNAQTSALETLENRIGVCRDFTHLGIALCRSLNIPARMVVGYLHELDPMDLHAWFEAFVNGRWYTFDATQAVPKGNRISVAYGRDAADVAFVTQFGPMTLDNMEVWVKPADTDTPT
nr:transglutaminase family protein [uncultured Arsenicibacter sp.]